jgi:TorA maturation chaperone TorD
VAQEYQDLFIGVGRGEVVPYGSWYMTGFLMDKPLALLRTDLQALGFERQPQVKEPEDHAGALCETMAMLIAEGRTLDVQRRFFHGHMGPWMKPFFRDLGDARAAAFYRAVSQFGGQFIEFEEGYLTMLV